MREQVKDLASQAKEQAVERADQVGRIVDKQKRQTAERLGGLAVALHEAAEKLEEKDTASFGRYAHRAADQVDRASRYLREKNFRSFVRDGEVWVRRHPDLFLSGSLGAGVLVARFLKSSAERRKRFRQSFAGDLDYPGTRDAFREDQEGDGEGRLDTAKAAFKRAAGNAADLATDAREKVGDLASQAGDKLGELTDRVKEQASDLTDKVKEQASDLGDKVQRGTRRARLGFWQLLEERPLAVGAATLAIGLLAGLSIPSTDVEDELLGETRDQLFDAAKEAGRETLDKGKHLAVDAAHAVVATMPGQGTHEEMREPELARL